MTRDQLKKKWNQCALHFHTDVGDNEAAFKQCNDAWETLGDDDLRAAYDRRMGFKQKPQSKSSKGASVDPNFDPLIDWANRLSDKYEDEIWNIHLNPKFASARPGFLSDLGDAMAKAALIIKPVVLEYELGTECRLRLGRSYLELVEKRYLDRIIESRPSFEEIFRFRKVLFLFATWLAPDAESRFSNYREMVRGSREDAQRAMHALWTAHKKVVPESESWPKLLEMLRAHAKSKSYDFELWNVLAYLLTEYASPRLGAHRLVMNLFPTKPSRFLEKERADDELMRDALSGLISFLDDHIKDYIPRHIENSRYNPPLFIGYTLEKQLAPAVEALSILQAQWRRFPDISVRAEELIREIRQLGGARVAHEINKISALYPEKFLWRCERILLNRKLKKKKYDLRRA